jgi:hypothetical protein
MDMWLLVLQLIFGQSLRDLRAEFETPAGIALDPVRTSSAAPGDSGAVSLIVLRTGGGEFPELAEVELQLDFTVCPAPRCASCTGREFPGLLGHDHLVLRL